MLFWTLYLYELKKIFSHRIKLLVLLVVAAFLFFVSAQRYFTDVPETNAWKAEQLLEGRTMDDDFFTEMREDSSPDVGGLWRYATSYARTVFSYNEPTSIVHSSEERANWTEEQFYTARKRVIGEFADAFFLTRDELAHWEESEEKISKPFVYRSTRDIENIRATYQFTLTITCMLIAVFLSGSFAGETETKTDAVLHALVYIIGCILTGILTMLLSLLFNRSMGAAGTIFAIILFDLFGNIPTSMRLLSQVRYLTPITVLLNTNIPDMRLTKIFGRYLISFQTAPILYVILGAILIIMTVRIFRRRYG